MKEQKFVRILCIADLHGRPPKIYLKKKEYDCIACVGDILGDDERDLADFYKKLRWKMIEKEGFLDKEKAEKILDEKMKKYPIEKKETSSIKKGRRIFKLLNSKKKPVFVVPGNWDKTSLMDGFKRESKGKITFEKIVKNYDNVYNVRNSKKKFFGINFVGIGGVSAPEIIKKIPKKKFIFKKDFLEYSERLKNQTKEFEKVKKIFEKVKNEIVFFISHNAPYKSKLDLVKSKESYAYNQHYGSKICRKILEKFSPIYCICGHIHEGFGTDKIGKTNCMNLGFTNKRNVLIVIDKIKKKVEKVEIIE